MKLSTLSSLVIITLSLFQISCMQQDKKQDPYKEGDIVTWKINDHLILKAKVGQRREHSLENHSKRGEGEFYRPQYERYIGQFPIDYQPTRFDKISEEKATEMPISKTSGGGYEFNLMLNGSWVQASDRSVVSDETLDDGDQVKVVVNPYRGLKQINSKQFFDLRLMEELNVNSAEVVDGITCYRFRDGPSHQRCFGHSLNEAVSGFDIYVSKDTSYRLSAESLESIYGGIKVNWYTDQTNIARAQEIDTAIWRLLNIWNISPIE
ncbi:hypothetical protein [Psychrobacter fozii]|uniref:hypothetical protein n=1 Tax=Psychrobacter fozii TaxID=198480 RepID=UPI001919ADBD|nr:hypothetical protein [Psychrobacter fozii]